MSNHEGTKSLFKEIDTNRDGVIDKGEFNNWVNPGVGTTSYDSLDNVTYRTRRGIIGDTDRIQRVSYNQNVLDSATTGHSLYRSSIGTRDSIREATVFTNSVEETEAYLARNNIDLCRNPHIVRRTISEDAINYEQKVFLRYLQPPAPPRPGPLIIQEEYEHVQAPAPLVIRETATTVTQAPLVLRERPPLPPPVIPSETRVRRIAGVTPRRSIVIERFPAQEKPRDIIIERWLPYGPTPEREVIVRKGVQQEIAQGTCTIILYDAQRGRTTRRFEIIDVTNADPEDYLARYRESLLDSTTLVQTARHAGVIEDISRPSSLATEYHIVRKSVDYNTTRGIIHESYSTSHTTGSDGFPLNAGLSTVNYGPTRYLSSSTGQLGNSEIVDVTTVTQREHLID